MIEQRLRPERHQRSLKFAMLARPKKALFPSGTCAKTNIDIDADELIHNQAGAVAAPRVIHLGDCAIGQTFFPVNFNHLQQNLTWVKCPSLANSDLVLSSRTTASMLRGLARMRRQLGLRHLLFPFGRKPSSKSTRLSTGRFASFST